MHRDDNSHTPASMTFKIGDALFVGDLIFMPDFGTARCDFPGGSPEVMYDSIHKLYELPDETRVFTCHDYQPGGRPLLVQTTVDEQKRANIQLDAATTREEYVAFRTGRDAELSADEAAVAELEPELHTQLGSAWSLYRAWMSDPE